MSKLFLKNVRLSFPSLWKTEVYNGTDTEKYTATFLISKDDPQVKSIKMALKSIAEEEFGTTLPKGLKYCLNDGDETEYNGYAGCYSLKASTKRRPVTIDGQKVPVTQDDNVIYAGCYVNASINFWVMDNQYGKRVLANLNGVQFSKDGESFVTGGSDAMDDFEVLEQQDEFIDPFGDMGF